MKRSPGNAAAISALAGACVAAVFAGYASAGEADPAAALARAVEQTRRDIDRAKSLLLARRREISSARVALSRHVAELSSAIKDKREAAGAIRRERDARESGQHALRERAEALEEEVAVARSILVEARRGVEAQLGLVDAAARGGDLAEIDRLLRAAEKETAALPSAAGGTLSFLAGHIEEAGRLRAASGRAVGPDGREHAGRFVHVGDVVTLFAAEGSDGPAGIVRVQHGSPRPHVWPVPARRGAEAIAELALGGEALVPLDLTSGAALRAASARRTLGEHVRSGGVVMIPIIAIAIVCLAIGAWKMVELSRVPTSFDGPLSRLLGLLEAGSIEEAKALAAAARPPLRRLMEEGIGHADAPRQDLEEVMRDTVAGEVPPLERRLSIVSVGAAVSPLLGLLGTVTGMIHTFSLIAVFGTGDAKMLSGGISEALVTTEAGLVAAIPLLLLHAFLSRRVRAITDGLETGAVNFVNALKGPTAEAPGAEAKGGTS